MQINQTINRPELPQILHPSQKLNSAPPYTISFIVPYKHCSQDVHSHQLKIETSFISSPVLEGVPTPSSRPGWAPAEGRCCEFSVAWSVNSTLPHRIPSVYDSVFQCQRCAPPGPRTTFTTRLSRTQWSSWHPHRSQWPSQLSCGGKGRVARSGKGKCKQRLNYYVIHYKLIINNQMVIQLSQLKVKYVRFSSKHTEIDLMSKMSMFCVEETSQHANHPAPGLKRSSSQRSKAPVLVVWTPTLPASCTANCANSSYSRRCI